MSAMKVYCVRYCTLYTFPFVYNGDFRREESANGEVDNLVQYYPESLRGAWNANPGLTLLGVSIVQHYLWGLEGTLH